MRKKATAWQYIKQYKFRSLLLRNFAFIIFMMILPLAIVIASGYGKLDNEVNERIMDMNEDLLRKNATVTDNVILDIQSLLNQIAEQSEIRQILQERDERLIGPMAQGPVYQLIREYTQTNRYIRGVYLYSEENGFIIDGSAGTYRRAADSWEKEKWYYIHKQIPMDDMYVLVNHANSIFLCRPIFSAQGQRLGLTVFDVQLQRIHELLEDYYLTTDGMYIDAFMQDSRLPGPAFPDNEAEMKKVSLARFPGRGEHFSGRLTRHDDGVVRCHGGLPACEAGNVIRIEGLEHVKHIAPVPFRFTPEEATEIQRSVQDGAAQPQKKEALRAFPAKHLFAWENVLGYTIQKDGLPAKGMVCLAYDAENLYLRYTLSGIRWVNGGNEWRALFKTGDCVDFQCSPAANRRTAPAPGDFRVLIAPFKGENAVVLMRQVEERKAFDPAESYKYSSPVMDVRFDTVRLLREAQACVQKIKDGVRVEAALPWKALGITSPTQGTRLTGDAGFIVADQAGRANSARVYYYNEKTNLVNDQGGEARISPEEFGEIAF